MGHISSENQRGNMKIYVVLALVGAACAAALPLEAPEPVQDTEDVVKARAEFLVLFDAAAAAAAADEVPEVVVPEGAPESVQYTEEVASARAAHLAAVEAAVAADGTLPEVVVPEGAPEPVEDPKTSHQLRSHSRPPSTPLPQPPRPHPITQ